MGGREHTCEMTALLAERVRVAESENAALRKRAEELEQAHAVCLSVHKDCEGCLAAEARAEKAERELDLRKRLMHGLPICGGCMGKYSECQACRADRAERERDSYRRDFDGTAKVYELLRAEFNALLARAEKAERERDEAMHNHGE